MTLWCSIVIPAYNAQCFLGKCLDSCLEQTCSEAIEVICVDDGSTDGTWGVIESYIARDSRVRGIRQENAGVVFARKTGVEHACGDYVFFCDADDILLPDCLAVLGSFLKQGDFDIVRGNEKRDAQFRGIEMVRYALRHGDDNLWGMLIRRTLFDGFEYVPKLKWGEDFAADVQLYLKARQIRTVARKVYDYQSYDTSVTRNAPYTVFLTAYDSIQYIEDLLERTGVMPNLRPEWICFNLRVRVVLSYLEQHRYKRLSFSLQRFLWRMMIAHPIAFVCGVGLTSGIAQVCAPLALLAEPLAALMISVRNRGVRRD